MPVATVLAAPGVGGWSGKSIPSGGCEVLGEPCLLSLHAHHHRMSLTPRLPHTAAHFPGSYIPHSAMLRTLETRMPRKMPSDTNASKDGNVVCFFFHIESIEVQKYVSSCPVVCMCSV